MHKLGRTREVRGRMIRSIDVEYKRIELLAENLSQILSQSTQTRSVDEKDSEVSTLKFVTQICFVRAEASQKISAKKSTVMAKSAHFVVHTMATIVACQ